MDEVTCVEDVQSVFWVPVAEVLELREADDKLTCMKVGWSEGDDMVESQADIVCDTEIIPVVGGGARGGKRSNAGKKAESNPFTDWCVLWKN